MTATSGTNVVVKSEKESNWRWNVWEMGFDPEDVYYAARSNDYPDLFVVQRNVGPPPGIWLYWNAADMPMEWGWVGFQEQTGPFPHPYEGQVEPEY